MFWTLIGSFDAIFDIANAISNIANAISNIAYSTCYACFSIKKDTFLCLALVFGGGEGVLMFKLFVWICKR